MYNTDLYMEELNKINNLEVFKTTKKALMSIYSYFIKLGADAETGLKISFEDIFDRYKRWHIFAKTKANFVKLSYKLVNLGLLTIEKIGNKNIYFARKINTENISESTDKNNENLNENLGENSNENILIENGVKEEVNKGVKVKKPGVPSTDTEIEEGTLDTQILNTKDYYNYIITDTENDNNLFSSESRSSINNPMVIPEVKLSNYEKAIIENNKDTLEYTKACAIGFDILEERNIKSEKIIGRVVDTLMNLDKVIVRKNASAYIGKVIDSACEWYERRRIAYATKVKYDKSYGGYNTKYNKSYNNGYRNNNKVKAYNLNEMTLDEINKIFD